MEILCPNCQKKLTILEQYAGQMMKCPMCGGTFTAPALPPAEPAAMAGFEPPPPPPPPFSSVPPAPSGSAAPGPASLPPSPPISEQPVPADYTGRFSISISPRVTQFIPAGLLFLVFVLTFFAWVGIRPGGVWLDSQTAWQVIFGGTSTPDRDAEPLSWFKERGKQRVRALQLPMAGEAEPPGWGFLMLFYLPLLLLSLAAATAVVAAPKYQQLLPPVALKYLQWGWPAVAVVTLLAFALLLLQSAVGFSLERRASEAVDKVTKKNEEDWNKMQAEASFFKEIPAEVAIFRGTYQQAIVRTAWFRWAFWLHFFALVFIVVTVLAELRGPRPNPRVDVLW
jgi:hypothetical protein